MKLQAAPRRHPTAAGPRLRAIRARSHGPRPALSRRIGGAGAVLLQSVLFAVQAAKDGQIFILGLFPGGVKIWEPFVIVAEKKDEGLLLEFHEGCIVGGQVFLHLVVGPGVHRQDEGQIIGKPEGRRGPGREASRRRR